MASKIKTDQVETLDGTGNITLNNSVTMAANQTLPAPSLTGTLPAISGVNLTALNATNLGSGTIPTARLGSGTANTTVFLRGDGSWQVAGSTSASDLSSGTLPMARLSGTLPALAATNLTAIPAANITGTLPAISGASLTSLPTQGFVSHQTFTSSGTWTRPSGITTIKVYVCGGGGGGGSGNSGSWTSWTSGGAGGGGTAVKVIDVTSISSVTVTIGAGGVSNAVNVTSTSGGTSTFGSHCSGLGGDRGQYQNVPGQGGGATGGDYIIYGDSGSKNNIHTSTWFYGGKGGSSFFGRGASGTTHDGVQGGGGQGARAYTTGGGSDGTDGGDGFCLVEEYK
jgi:hypothetical protein